MAKTYTGEGPGPSFAPVGTDLSAMTEIAGYHGVQEVLRSPKFITELNDGTAPIRGDTILRIHGADHTRRRRTMNHLIRQDHHRWYRETALYPAIEAELERILAAPDDEGSHRADLAEFVPKIQVALSAAMIGLSEADRTERLEELMAIVAAFRAMAGVRWVFDPASKAEILERAHDAKRSFDEGFIRPNLNEHRRLVKRYQAGALAREQLPLDFLTLVAVQSDPGLAESLGIYPDPTLAGNEAAVREAIATLIIGAVDTTTFTVMWCVEELTDWFAGHPGDWASRTDDDFLYRAVLETLRLHAVHPAFMRQATEDVELSDGTSVRAGEMVALRTGLASRDPSVFGSDADEFDPYRAVPRGVAHYGLAFGSGAHMCYGQPIVLGNEGKDGSLVYIVRSLYAAGMQPDPAHPPRKAEGTYHEKFSSYPVVFGPGRPGVGRSSAAR